MARKKREQAEEPAQAELIPAEGEQAQAVEEQPQVGETMAGEVKRRGRPKKENGTKPARKNARKAVDDTPANQPVSSGGRLEEIIRWSVQSEANLEKLYQVYLLVK